MVAHMTPLADTILIAATVALTRRRAKPSPEFTLQQHREDARAVSVAVLVAIAGAKGTQEMGLLKNGMSRKFLSLADELDQELDLSI
jgi:hypothetical protein